ncbi:MAG: hypothetical protein FJY85_24705, partial [Deltaproteobacteria bacterium]|nr:hypothetical protein [Deltaproteobacteria bacterium]
MSNGLAGQEFPKGLALIYVSQVPLPGPNPEDYETLKKPLTLSGQIVEVPIGTKYVHIAVVAMDMLFGTLSDTIAPSKLGRIGFEVI